MKSRWTLFPSLLLLLSCAHRVAPVSESAAGYDYPEAPRGEVVDNYHGTLVADPYRWLEDPDSPESRSWIEAENKLTHGWLGEVEARGDIHDRLEHLWNYERYGHPVKRGERWFYTHNDGLQDQSVLFSTSAIEEEGTVLIDPNTLSEDGTMALSGWSPSPDGDLLAYGLSDAGSDWRSWHILNVSTGEALEDVLEWSKFSGVSWLQDGSGFYYGRYPAPEEGVSLQQTNYNQALYFHAVGTPQSEDLRVFDSPDHPDRSASGHVSEDGRYLVITVWKDTSPTNQLYIQELGVDPVPQVIVSDFEAGFYFLGNEGDRLFFMSNEEAPRWRILALDLASEPTWTEVIAQREEAMDSASLVGSRLALSYLQDARAVVNIHELSGELVTALALPGLGSVNGFGGRQDDPETFYTYSDFTTPGSIYRLDIQTLESSLFRQPVVDFDATPYVTEQVFYESADGTSIPMFLTHREGIDLDGSHPVLLYGYGGFSIPITPRYSTTRSVWLEMGGIYAVANLRGGGEYGEEWHEAGTLHQKQNVFDDFIAAAEYLVAEGYTRPEGLGIQGRSNGGLLVGACITQRPDLFGAALPGVGVMDMLRYHQFTIGYAWASDYGTSEDPEMFATLFDYSPVHNTVPGMAYPSTMVTTGDHDDRVVPAHSFKFAAALQYAQAGPDPVLIRIETRTGHGSGKPTALRIEEATDELAFLVRALDMTLEWDQAQDDDPR